MKLYKGLIPWGPTGPLDFFYEGQTSVYDSKARAKVPLVFKENNTFCARLEFVAACRGRSAVQFRFRAETGAEFVMRLGCMEEFLKRGCINNGWTGTYLWALTKQGSNFSLMLVES